MSDQTGNTPQDDDQSRGQQPPPYPPPQQPPFGQPPQAQPQQPPAYQQPQYGQPAYGEPPYGQPAYGGYGPAGTDPDKRPATVTAAGVITLVLSGITLVLLLVTLLGLGVLAREDLVEQLGGDPALQNIDTDTVVAVLRVVFGVFIVWSAIAMVLAYLAMRRSNAARIGLVVSSALTALLSLFAIMSGASVVTLVAAVAVIVCLFTGGAGPWYARSGGGPGHRGMPPPVA